MNQHHANHHDANHHDANEPHEHDRGLSHDLPTLLSRRRALALIPGFGALAVAACSAEGTADSGSGAPSAAASTTAASASTASAGASATTAATTADTTAQTITEEIPEETGGPYPADGSNGVNVLTESGIVRSDITTSFGGASGVAAGVPLTVTLTVLDLSNGTTTPLAGSAVYLWHADAEGRYSMYSNGVTDENYLRGVQEADESGAVTFTSVFPSAYDGRWPHMHFEVYPDLASATSASGKLRTSQLAFPEDVCDVVYATDLYPGSAQNMSRTSLESDMVFSDGYSLQLAKMSGDVASGYTATLTVPV